MYAGGMALPPTPSRFVAALFAGALTASCSDQPVLGPLLPPNPPDNPAIVAAAWAVDVDRATGTVEVTSPNRGFAEANLRTLADYFGLGPDAPDLSILAGDVVDIIVDPASLVFLPVGAFTPGLVRVQFDVAIRNKLSALSVVTPTFPTPPPLTQGLLLLPIETVVTETPGSVTGSGANLVVELPNTGSVAPSVDFDQPPFNFFNDRACGPQDNDCYRYETFPSPLLGGALSTFRTIGFDVEPTVSTFRARLLLAGDVTEAPVNAWGVWTDTLGAPITTARVGEEVELQLCFDAQNSATLAYLDMRQFTQAAALIALNLDSAVEGTGPCASSVPDVLTNIQSGLLPQRVVLSSLVVNGGAQSGINGIAKVRMMMVETGELRPSIEGFTSAGSGVAPLLFQVESLPVVGTNGSNLPPIADAGSPYVGGLGSSITLDGSASRDLDGSIVSWRWTFGNGIPPTQGPITTFSCPAEAHTRATLEVVDDLGSTSTTSTSVSCEDSATFKLFGVWTDRNDQPIQAATQGQPVRLHLCATQRAELSAFQASYFVAELSRTVLPTSLLRFKVRRDASILEVSTYLRTPHSHWWGHNRSII